jgi:hypothetical protein
MGYGYGFGHGVGKCGGGDEFNFQIINQQTTSGQFSTTSGKTVTVDWGDSTSNDYTGTSVAWTHTYATYSGVTYDCKMTNASALTKITNTTGAGTGIKFDVGNLPANVLHLEINANNTVYGLIDNLPNSMTRFTAYGQNLVGGSIDNMPSSITIFQHTNTAVGAGVITGNIANFNRAMSYLTLNDLNEVTGNASDVPYTNIVICWMMGNGYLTGNIAGMPNATAMTQFILTGANSTTTGDVGDFQSVNCPYIFIKGNFTDYTTRTYPSTMQRIRYEPFNGYGLSSAEVDQVLIDLARDATTWTGSEKTVWLAGYNAARTSASDAAVTTLVTRGVAVTTNL